MAEPELIKSSVAASNLKTTQSAYYVLLVHPPYAAGIFVVGQDDLVSPQNPQTVFGSLQTLPECSSFACLAAAIIACIYSLCLNCTDTSEAEYLTCRRARSHLPPVRPRLQFQAVKSRRPSCCTIQNAILST